MYFVTKRVTFEASHRLPLHAGKCQNLHGHSYKIEVTIGAVTLNNLDFVIDFGDLNNLLKRVVVDKYDHKHLNDLMENPTAERLADTIFTEVEDGLVNYREECFTHSVRVWETEDSYASVVAPL